MVIASPSTICNVGCSLLHWFYCEFLVFGLLVGQIVKKIFGKWLLSQLKS